MVASSDTAVTGDGSVTAGAGIVTVVSRGALL
ncbi:putative membrane protein, partial [Escherichia coli 96.0939]